MATQQIKPVEIDGRLVGPGNPCLVIAEAGVNHNGDVTMAHKLIELAAQCGVDAIKFQTFVTDNVESTHALKPSYFNNRESTSDKLEFSRSIELSADEFRGLKAHAESLKLMFLSTACDTAALDILIDIGVSALKIGSSDTNNLPLLRLAAQTGLPILLSTGISTESDVDSAVHELRSHGCKQLILFQCTSNYPIKSAEANVQVIRNWQKRFCIPVGFSDHTEGIHVACGAVALGACALEKHFTISRLLPGVDHAASLEPSDMRLLVQSIRDVESSIGDGAKTILACEQEHLLTMRKSLVAARNLPTGHVLSADDILVKRPGSGIAPTECDVVVGRRIKQAVAGDDILQWDMFE